jgi:hypothetical protein
MTLLPLPQIQERLEHFLMLLGIMLLFSFLPDINMKRNMLGKLLMTKEKKQD